GGPQPLGLVGGGGAAVGPGGAALVGEKPSKEEEEALWSNVAAQAAFLGPNLWDRTLPYDADLKEYVDLDEFLSENGIPVEGEAATSPGSGGSGTEHQAHALAAAASRTASSSTPPHQQHQHHHGQHQHHQGQQAQPPLPEPDQGEDSLPRRPRSRSPRPESYDGGDERHFPSSQDNVVKVEHSRGRMLRCSPQPSLSSAVNPTTPDADTVALLSGCVAGPPSPADSDFSMSSSTTTTTGHDFDPRTRAFSDEELKPQPMIKKSKKQVPHRNSKFVPDDLKDEKYWARRRKNNMAAKRSRDARRVKENQIALRAGFLEKENVSLRQELERLKKENSILRDRLTKYTEV
ncbi:thyrotroph embryonic factor-like, partial [Hetaerina americana]|uniref:thyrotroph embryonic factor-like n=1 Tax=Hetaerina americana TaxID=62018 RepID=UPI003A7F3454